MRLRHLRHRAVYVVVRTSDDGVVVHRRADWKDVYPGAWDICFGGVLAAGEDWDDAARRELAEEAGIEADVQLLGVGSFEDEASPVNGRIYGCTHDGPYPCPDGEVVEVRVVRRADLTGGADVCAAEIHDVAQLFPGMTIGVDPQLAGPAGEPGSGDPVRFGTSDILSFSAGGTCTAGTLFLRSSRGTQYAVRISNVTTRTRLLRYEAGLGQWVAA